MWKEVFLMCLAMGTSLAGFPYINATKGLVWPAPKEMFMNKTFYYVTPLDFNFTIVDHSCDILTLAIDRYSDIIFPDMTGQKRKVFEKFSSKDKTSAVILPSLDIVLTEECEHYPYLGMNEEYEIKITSINGSAKGTLTSKSIWGVLRGIETFVQLLVPAPEPPVYTVNATYIIDGPRFPHRGLLIDTGRHFVSVMQILYTIDLLAMNKMNVLHWHIVDSQSFSYGTNVYPDLTAKGAYTKSRVYAEAEIKEVVGYGRLNGVRVIPEFDTPGHTQSWGPGLPGFLTECYAEVGHPDGTFGPVDPTNVINYEYLLNLFEEVTHRFPDRFLHLGGDEVDFDCWKSNRVINDFMKEHNITGDYNKLEQFYITRLLEVVSNLTTDTSYLVWQDVFDNGVELSPEALIQVWKEGWQKEMAEITKSGYHALLSSCWYLDHIGYGDDWKNYYKCEPFQFNGTESQKSLVLGGEACMWGEFVDKTNIIPRTWPRASAVAEKLWSPEFKTLDVDSAAPRLEEFRCKLVFRGYDVEPLGPSFCPGDNM